MAQEGLKAEEVETMRQLRSEGSTLEAIADATGRSLGAVSRAVKGIRKPLKPKTKAEAPTPGKSGAGLEPTTSSAEKPQFLDNEARFLSLLKSYGIKDAERVVNYISSQGENGYTNLETLKRNLVEQGVPGGKVGAIIRHHAAIEQIPVPERLVPELGPEAPARQPVRRFSIINNLPVPDPEGDYTFTEALRVIGTKSGGGDDDTKALLAGIYKKLTEAETGGLSQVRDELRALREERAKAETAAVMTSLQGLRADMTAIKADQRSKSEYDIMGQGLSVLDRRLGSIESGIMARWSIPPRPMPPGQKEELTQAISEQSQAEEELDRLADIAFYGGKSSAQPQQPVAPPASYE